MHQSFTFSSVKVRNVCSMDLVDHSFCRLDWPTSRVKNGNRTVTAVFCQKSNLNQPKMKKLKCNNTSTYAYSMYTISYQYKRKSCCCHNAYCQQTQYTSQCSKFEVVTTSNIISYSITSSEAVNVYHLNVNIMPHNQHGIKLAVHCITVHSLTPLLTILSWSLM